MEKQYYIYILTNQRNTVFYIGVTSNLVKRVWEHKHKLVGGFTKKYNIDQLIYYEVFNDSISAIIREKKIKGWTRAKKLAMIKILNPKLKDLYKNIL